MTSTETRRDRARRPASKFSIWLLYAFALVLALTGAAMLVGGGILASEGGSLYYATAGAMILAAAVLLFLRRRAGAWVYGAVLALTIGWGIYEVGFDGWMLAPRVIMLLVMGLWLILPWTQSPLRGGLGLAQRLPGRAAGLLAGVGAASVLLGASLHWTIADRPADPLYQTGPGAFPAARGIQYAGAVGEDWPYFGGDNGGGRFSPLDQITPANVTQLERVWTGSVQRPATNATPLKVGDALYLCASGNLILSLDAATGKERWSYDASGGYPGVCRGVAYHIAPELAGQECHERILTGNGMAQLIALDAVTGAPCAGFGEGGIKDLTRGMADFLGETIPGYYRVTSAPTVVRGNVVVGGWVTDGQYWGEVSGVVRAFDAITGEFAWAWDMGDPDDHSEPAEGKTYTTATPNSWAPMSADEELGLVYFPTGNATPDFYGPQRRTFDDAYSTSVIAVNAETGEYVWHFQTVHHDLWDYDVASQPTLIDLPGENGAQRPALIQTTKHGEIYLLDRLTGVPIFAVTETPVPQDGAVPQERLSPTQPFSNGLPSLRGAKLREADMWGITPFDQLYCRIGFARARYEGIFTPPGLDPSIIFPATFGAANWGSASIDPEHGVMVINHNRFISYMELLTRANADAMGLKPQGAYASASEVGSVVPQAETEYAAFPRFWFSPIGIPCLAPPYSRLSAIDLNTGDLLWSERLGTSKNSGAFGLKMPLAIPMGTPTHGGSLVTGSGLVFIGQTADDYFRAFDLRTGKVLWQEQLEGGPSSVPVSYTIDGRQYIAVIAAGQGAIRSTFNTKIVAFALPE
ncbi:MAG: membrane-bound PQQ-dependent dehydrogenase, glucose/quinate/shikimate family [Paracoccus sp. (in: a-proteobacteria)]|uniref:membrane-bound PQQ-dependent dehydrogenase, glucose/quinate/shikimate family n=1 Tax=Paracoccus sp. TaxID=267 RepID=UPI0039E690C3